MKKNSIGLLVLMSLFLFVACNVVESPFGGAKGNAYLNMPTRAYYGDFLSENEQAVIAEMNFARTEPGRYVKEVLQPFLDNECGSEDTRTTYVQTAIDTMTEMQEKLDAIPPTMDPLKPLTPALGLTLAARDFIADPGRDVHSSTSPGFEGFGGRAKLYGTTSSGEIAWPNGGFGNSGRCSETATAGWIIDRGNAPGYGHRKAILSSGNLYIGVAFGYGAPDSTVKGYRNKPATYATLANGSYKDLKTGNYKDDLPLHNASIARVVTWPVLRYIDGKFVQFGAGGQRGAPVKDFGGKTTYLPESYSSP